MWVYGEKRKREKVKWSAIQESQRRAVLSENRSELLPCKAFIWREMSNIHSNCSTRPKTVKRLIRTPSGRANTDQTGVTDTAQSHVVYCSIYVKHAGWGFWMTTRGEEETWDDSGPSSRGTYANKSRILALGKILGCSSWRSLRRMDRSALKKSWQGGWNAVQMSFLITNGHLSVTVELLLISFSQKSAYKCI